jgi:hypothetical protein
MGRRQDTKVHIPLHAGQDICLSVVSSVLLYSALCRCVSGFFVSFGALKQQESQTLESVSESLWKEKVAQENLEKQIVPALRQMVCATAEPEFDRALASLREILEAKDMHEFVHYFDSQWLKKVRRLQPLPLTTLE